MCFIKIQPDDFYPELGKVPYFETIVCISKKEKFAIYSLFLDNVLISLL